jgi:hypothetical protein
LRFAVVRPGDHLFCPFQCELCHFRNIQGRSPNRGLGPLDDTELMKSLRRVNLDAFWSRKPTTVAQHLGKVNRDLQIAHEMGMSNPPMPKLGAAAIVARHSMDPGITEDTVQFETVRKIKSAFVNLYQASVENASTAVIGGKDGKKQLVMGVPIYHGWYDRSQTGMHHHMGDNIVQDYGLSRKAAMALQGLLEAEWAASRESEPKRLEVAQLACFVFLGYARALRGEEITKIELGGVRKYFADGGVEPKHVTLSLSGRFKQLEGDKQLFLPVAAVTGSGIRIREWVGSLMLEKEAVGLVSGFLFLKREGTPTKAIDFEEALVESLEWIQQNTSGVIPLTVNLWEEFGVRRSMRGGATTEALNAGIDGPTIDADNGWRQVEAAKGKMPIYSMRQRYTQVFQDLKHQLMFSLGI